MPHIEALAKCLITWFDKERAHLPVPGRNETDPYAIWIAEIMLQQTQVTTVWPYYNKWMDRFPTVQALAEANQDEVLKSWEGMGYYSRARNLHAAARRVVDEYAGVLPASSSELIKLPGIGPYTAASIASLAFDEVVSLVDGNVLRVYARLMCFDEDISRARSKTTIKTALQEHISKQRPGAFNQAIMDLGRAICTPRDPKCTDCPLQTMCCALEAGEVESYPVKPRSKGVPHYHIVIGLIEKDGQYLIQRRPEEGLLGGLWEFPGGKIRPGEQEIDALHREIQEETDLEVMMEEKIATIRHAYTHFKITMTAYQCKWVAGEAQMNAATENQWVTPEAFNRFAFPKANLKILEKFRT